MSLFSKKNKEIEDIILRLEMNKSNNYKDAAQDNLVQLKKRYEELVNSGKLSAKLQKHYKDVIASYEESMKGYTHKDQTPYWK